MSKKGVIGLVLFTVSLCTVTVFGISILIQPILPQSTNAILVIFVASFVGVIGALAAFNEIVELFQKIFGNQSNVSTSINERSLKIYCHSNSPYNAAKILYTGTEIAKDFVVNIEYIDNNGNPAKKLIIDFFPKEDPRMWQHYYKYDFLEPNQVAYFHLIKKKSTSNGKVLVVATFTGALSGKMVRVNQEIELKEF